MRQLFDLEGPFLSGLNKLADIIILNIIYLVCCIPVFTIGPATTALYYVTLKMAKNEDCYPVKSYFKSFKDNFKQGTVIWLILLAVAVILFLDLKITNGEYASAFAFPESIASIMIILILLAMFIWTIVVSYVFPVLSKFDNTVKNTLRNSLLMGIKHLPWTVLILLINVLPWFILYILPGVFIILAISFALCAYGCSFIFVRIFKNYIPEEAVVTSDEQFSINPDQESFLFKDKPESLEESEK